MSSTTRALRSYQLVADRFKEPYLAFYRELYKEEANALDLKTIELISVAVSIATGCKGCLDGHLRKAAAYGATKSEVGEAVAVAMAVGAATMVDRTDIANFDGDGLVDRLWDENGDSRVRDPKARPKAISSS